jgi:hypothetical protein
MIRDSQAAVSSRTLIFPETLRQILTKDWILAVGLFLLAIVTRLPFQSKILYHWDSVNFSYAIREFSVAKEQPQPPGYIVYVWLTRLVDVAVHNAQITLVSISIVASALAVAALFYLGRSMFGRIAGLIAALFLATSPLFWFYGEIALPHTLDTLLIIVSAWWLYETMRGDYRYLYPAIVVVTVAGGIRQQTLVFLMPLLVFALRGVGWRRFLTAGVLGVLICLAWFIPLIVLSDGLSNYMHVTNEFTRRFQSTTSIFLGAGWPGVMRNSLKLVSYTLYGWSIALVPAVVYAIARLWRRDWPQSWAKSFFLLLWMAPALAFYSFIHMGQQGLIFVYLPALSLFSALGLARLVGARSHWLPALTTAMVLLNASIFLLAPEYPMGPTTQRLLTRANLINSDHYFQDRFEVIEKSFPVESTAILAANWHHVEYYLPEYTTLHFNVDGTNPSAHFTPAKLGLQPLSDGQVTIVIFDPELRGFNQAAELVKVQALPGGGQLEYVKLRWNDQLYLDANSFGLLSDQPQQQQ